MPVSTQTAVSVVSSAMDLQRTIRCASQASVRPGEPGLALQAVLRYVRDHQPTRASDIADWIGIGAAPLSRHIADLQGYGYVERVIDPADRRAQLITLTQSGTAYIGQVWRRRTELLQELLAGWEEAEIRQAVEVMTRLEETLAAGLRTVKARREALLAG